MNRAAPDSIKSVPELLVWQAERFPHKEALYHKDKGWWQPVTWGDYLKKVNAVAGGLIGLGVQPEDRVAILSNTQIEWVIADMAIMSCGAITVPIYQSNTPAQCAYIIHHSQCEIIFLEDQEQLDKLLEIWDSSLSVKTVIVFEKFHVNDSRVISFHHSQSLGQNGANGKIRDILRAIEPHDPATLVYTSGTTGPPKGAVLTHRNILFTIRSIVTGFDITEDDLSIAYLPMAHIAERMVGSFIKLISGARTAFAESMDDLIFNMREVGPTFHFGTPRVFEKFHSRVITAIDDATGLQRFLYRWAEKVGSKEKDLRLNHQSMPIHLSISYRLADWLILRKIRSVMGGELRFLISGGAPISPEILKWMQNMGLDVSEVYGMTESTGLISMNTPKDNRLGSVGKALPGTKMQLAEDGEVLSFGDHVCDGYYNNRDDSQELIDQEGWLHSGDIGNVDSEGYLWINDRKKDIIITAGGKNIAPQNIENLMKTSRYISQCTVFGDRRKYLTALVTLDEDEITKFARDSQLIYSDLKELSQLPAVAELIGGEIERLNQQLASFETIKNFRILKEELSQDDEELTPTLKVKRNVVEKRYQGLIDEMYTEASISA